LVDSQADLLVYGKAERAIVDIAHRLAAGERIDHIRDVRGTSFVGTRELVEVDSTTVDKPGRVEPKPDPYAMEEQRQAAPCATGEAPLLQLRKKVDRANTVLRLPSFEAVSGDPVLYAHASRILHLESNPGNARAIVQRHG